ncbi:MAG: hypothetical protein A2W25_13230 [candidate division Zixibacteria bacterium RBG_16_53_22]|nr:MAG: hypothetical protein A2W25_13230 [candidate division Zixibacteria bacterium RBG_16_53_22]
MNQRYLIGIFEREEDILSATNASRLHGFVISDVYAPYAVHGLDKAIGLSPSRLPWVCFLLGLLGAALKVWFEFWTTGIDWPVNVGGKPWNSLPAFVPVTFEVMVFFAGVSTVIAFLFVSRLWPGARAPLADRGVTDNRFVLILEDTGPAFDQDRAREIFKKSNAVDIEERVETTR